MNKVLSLLLLVASSPLLLIAQNDSLPAPRPPWKTGASLGMDFSQLLQINPRQGAGQNKIGAGTAIAIFANYKKKSDCHGIIGPPGNLAFSE